MNTNQDNPSFEAALELALELERQGKSLASILATFPDYEEEILALLKVAKEVRETTRKVRARKELVERILAKLEVFNVTKE
jgi:hypothetical protein